ncbi:MAG: CehA/McbA family metallohydrolase [Coriobacteriia bacterium]|nr:CehA/McbA family metallohydrolase [Coriobacteriia bacterium]
MIEHEVWSKADIHIHSNHSDGLASVPQIMDYVQSKTDLGVIAITDHNTLEGARYARSMADYYDFDVVVGEEVSSRQGHILGLFIEEEVRPGMSASDTVRAIEEQGGIAVIAHPFSAKGVFGPGGRNMFTAAANEWAFHAFEVYNSLPFLVWANSMAAKTLAGGRGVAATGGSDAHVLEAVGRGYTLFRGESGEDLRASILNLETRAEASRQGMSLAWLYAMNIMGIRRQQALNRVRCKAE